jgi:hypothetical protein
MYECYTIHTQENAKFNSQSCFLSTLKYSVINCHFFQHPFVSVDIGHHTYGSSHVHPLQSLQDLSIQSL